MVGVILRVKNVYCIGDTHYCMGITLPIWVLQQVVCIIFNDHQVMFATHIVYSLLSMAWLGNASGVLASGDGVHNLGWSTLRVGIPCVHDLLVQQSMTTQVGTTCAQLDVCGETTLCGQPTSVATIGTPCLDVQDTCHAHPCPQE